MTALLTLLLEISLFRKIMLLLAVIATVFLGYSIWADHQRQIGAQMAMQKLREEERMNEQEIEKKSKAIDRSTIQENNRIQEILRRDWTERR